MYGLSRANGIYDHETGVSNREMGFRTAKVSIKLTGLAISNRVAKHWKP